MGSNKITIKETTLNIAFEVHKQIPEFAPNFPFSFKDFQSEVTYKKSLVLVAQIENIPVGYSIGYDKYEDGSFYTWMVGVIPEFRRLGVNSKLTGFQELWAKENNYKSIKIKTWNRRVEMRCLLAKLGYNIINIEIKPNVLDTRLMHERMLE